MKLSEIVSAYNTLRDLSDAILDVKLCLKINRIARELRDEAEAFTEAQKKAIANAAADHEKFGLQLGAKKVMRDAGFEMVSDDNEIREKINLHLSRVNSDLNEQLRAIADEERPLEIKSEKIKDEEIENAKFREKHEFKFSNLRFIEKFQIA